MGTRGHARTPKTHREDAICRKIVAAIARPCPPLPPQNLHGKEGVSGSSPEEGLPKSPANGHLCCLRWRDFDASRVPDGYILGRAGTRGHARRRATRPETCSRHSIATTHSKSSCKHAVAVARAGATLTPSFVREGVAARTLARQPGGRGLSPLVPVPGRRPCCSEELELRSGAVWVGGVPGRGLDAGEGEEVLHSKGGSGRGEGGCPGGLLHQV